MVFKALFGIGESREYVTFELNRGVSNEHLVND